LKERYLSKEISRLLNWLIVIL